MLILNGIDEIRARAGQELGVGDWFEVTREAVDLFADATGDHQLVHVDVEQARQPTLGGTSVHGFFTLSLASRLSAEIYEIQNVEFALNYGLDRVRFPAPLMVGGRMRVVLADVQDVPGGVQLTTACTFEVEGGGKPVCVAERLTRVVSHASG